MNDHDDTLDDLPGDVAARLRDVPPASGSRRDEHINAALTAIPAPGANVVPLRTRMEPRATAAAAAVALLLGVGLGWAVRGGDEPQMAVEMSDSTEVARNGSVEPASNASEPDGTEVKGATVTTDTSPTCDLTGVPGAKWLTDITSNGKRYAIFVTDASVQWYDLDTCAKLQDIPHPVATTP